MDEKALLLAEVKSIVEGPANGSENGEKSEKPADPVPRASTELPSDVRAKLLKLEKMESKYKGMCYVFAILQGLIGYRTPTILSHRTWSRYID